MYDLHSLYGQFSGCHFQISFLKASNDVSLNLLGTLFQIFRSRNKILSVPQKSLPTYRKLNCEMCRKL